MDKLLFRVAHSVTSCNQGRTRSVKNEILAKGIPALTRAAGRELIQIINLEGQGNLNVNDNDIKPNGTSHESDAWYHNDMKNLPYFQSYMLYELLSQ